MADQTKPTQADQTLIYTLQWGTPTLWLAVVRLRDGSSYRAVSHRIASHLPSLVSSDRIEIEIATGSERRNLTLIWYDKKRSSLTKSLQSTWPTRKNCRRTFYNILLEHSVARAKQRTRYRRPKKPRWIVCVQLASLLIINQNEFENTVI